MQLGKGKKLAAVDEEDSDDEGKEAAVADSSKKQGKVQERLFILQVLDVTTSI